MAKRLKQSEIDELMINLPLLPKKFEDWMLHAPFKNVDYMFYKRKGKNKTCVCSKCGEIITFQTKLKHNDTGKCKNCNAKVTFKAINIAKTYEDEKIVSLIQKMGEGFIVRYFKVERTFKNREDTSDFPENVLKTLCNPKISYYEGSIVYITFSKRGITQYRYYETNWSWEHGDYRWVNERKRSGYYNKELLREYDPFIYKKNIRALFKKMKWRYSGLEYFKGNYMNINDYLYTYEKYKSIEMITKLGLNKLLLDIVTSTVWFNPRYGETLNLDEKRLGLDAETFTKIIDMNLNYEEIEKLIFYQKQNLILSKTEFFKIKKYDLKMTGKILNYSSVTKMLNYLKKQSKKFDKNEKLILSTWRDYIKQCEYIKLNLLESAVIYPNELFKKHDEYTDIISKMKDKVVKEKFEKKYKLWSKRLTFNKGSMSIRVAETIDSLKIEGKILKHCVGSFGPEVAETDTLILFVRKKENVPFYTVEFNVKDFTIIQVQGKKRIEPTKKIDKFLESWELYIAEIRDIKCVS